MALIGSLIGKLLKRGSITIITPDGQRATYGPGGGKALTIRVADAKCFRVVTIRGRCRRSIYGTSG